MIALTLIPMIAALGLQAADAVPAEEPKLEHTAMRFPVVAFKKDIVARCSVTMDVRPNGSPTNMCGDCNVASPHDFVKAERFEKTYVREVLGVVREWRFAPSENGFTGYSRNFDFNLEHLNPDLLASLETPAAPVCD